MSGAPAELVGNSKVYDVNETLTMFRPPLPRTVLAHLSIHRIGGDLAPMVVVTAPSLAGRIPSGGLSRLKLRWLKRTLAMAADLFSHEPVLACQGALAYRMTRKQFGNSCRVRPRPRRAASELQDRQKPCCFISGAHKVSVQLSGNRIKPQGQIY
jgi:hypothetical protein